MTGRGGTEVAVLRMLQGGGAGLWQCYGALLFNQANLVMVMFLLKTSLPASGLLRVFSEV